MADFAVVTIASMVAIIAAIVAIIAHPDALHAAFVVTCNIAAAIAPVVAAFDNPASGQPDIHRYTIPISTRFSPGIAPIAPLIVATVDDDSGIIGVVAIVVAVINRRGDDDAAD